MLTNLLVTLETSNTISSDLYSYASNLHLGSHTMLTHMATWYKFVNLGTYPEGCCTDRMGKNTHAMLKASYSMLCIAINPYARFPHCITD